MSTDGADDNVTHLADYRRKGDEVSGDDVLRVIDLKLAAMLRDHFVEQRAMLERQNAMLAEQNNRLEEQVSRLLRGMDRLLCEVGAVRNGQQDEAFARVARHDENADLPTIQADVAVLYPYTSGDIGERLGFNASQVGMLLGAQGLRWVGKGEYEETTRWKKGRQRFWHKDLPDRLADILLNREPDEFGITNKAIQIMFTRYRQQRVSAEN